MFNTLPGQKAMFNTHSAAEKALRKLEEGRSMIQPKIGADKYSAPLFESKVISDVTYLNYLCESIVPVEQREEFLENVQKIYENVDNLLQEVDSKARLCSAALNSQINENTSIGIYSNYLTEKVNKSFSKPLFEGTLLTSHKDESKLLMESLVQSNAVGDVDPELFLKYAIFENTLTTGLTDIILSYETKAKVDKYISIQESEYFKIFDKNAKVLLDEITEGARVLSTMIAPKLFEESLVIAIAGNKKESELLTESEGHQIPQIDAKTFAGISRAFTVLKK